MKKANTMKRSLQLLRFLLVALAMALSSAHLQSATYTWTGAGFFGSLDYLWSNPNNWAELSAPQPGEQDVQLVFPNTNAPRSTTNDVLNLVIRSVIFQGPNYSVHGPGANGITMTLRGPAAGGAFAVAATANGCQFGSSTRLHLGSTGTVAVAGGTLTVKSRISGIHGLVKNGPGTMSFQGLLANTFTGPVTILNGVLDFRGVGTALPGALFIGDGTVGSTPVARLYLNDQISDASAVTVNANGTLELDGHDDLIGSLTLAGGATVTTIKGGITGTLALNGNVTNHVGVLGTAATIAGRLSLGSTPRGFFVDANSELVIAANISGLTAGVVKVGAGQLTLTGSGNTYFGATTVQAGTLALRGAAKPGSVDNGTSVAQGARLLLDHAAIGSEELSLAGTTNAPALEFHGTNSWAGAVTLSGACQIKPAHQLDGDDRMTFSGNISGTGSLRVVDWGDVYFTGFGNNTFSGGYYGESGLTHFAKSASAAALGGPLYVGRAEDAFPAAHVIVETLNQIPNDTPITLRNSGALTADADDTIGPVVFEGGWLMAMNGKLTLNGDVTIRTAPENTAAIYGKVVLPAGTRLFQFAEWGILDVYAVLEGAGGVTIRGEAGALQFYAANTYSGPTRVESAALYLREDGRPGSSASGTLIQGLGRLSLHNAHVTNETLTVNAAGGYTPWIASFGDNRWKGSITLNANADIQGFSGSELTLDGAISGLGGITYHGEDYLSSDGTLIFAGANDNTYQGATTILEGTLRLNKIGRAIPNSLTIGYATNGADAASVYCLRPGQFTPATDAAQMNMWRLTVNASGGFHCNGFDQTVPGITTRGGGVFTEGATLSLQQGWRVEPDSGTSHFFGQLQLNSLFDNFTHIVNVETNSTLFAWGDISQASFTANVEKQGKGTLSMISSNSFNGNLTLREGVTYATGLQPYGTVSGPTYVTYDATLVTFSDTNAEPFGLAGSGFQNQGALIVLGSSHFKGPIALGYNTDIVTPAVTNLAVFSGAISGAGGITKLGEGSVRLEGSGDNTFTGATKVKAGSLELAKTNATAIRGALDIAVGGGDALVRYLRDDQLSDLTPVNIGANGQLRVLGHSDTIGSLSGRGIVEMLAGSLITGHDNTETTYAGAISGVGGNLTKTGTNTFTLTGNNAYTGTTFVKGGTLLVRGQQPQSDVVIQTGGTLGGIGTVGSISDLSGHVKPGLGSYGTLKCRGYITHAPANVFQIEINGTTPGVNCDQLDVNGAVSLLGGTLQLAMKFSGAISNEYVIIKNDGSDPVAGTFAALPPDSTITNNGVTFQISYTGGDGNDVALIQKSIVAGPQLGSVQRLADATIQISGSGFPHAIYSVEATDHLTAPAPWTAIGQTTADATGQFAFTDPDAPNHPIRFYRFVAP